MAAEQFEEESPYGDERGRIYRASRGGKRVAHLRFIPATGDFDRQLPYHDIRNTFIRKDGREIRLDFSGVTVIITGRNLLPVASAIGVQGCSCIEAFDATRRDMPADDAPFVETIKYYLPEAGKEPG